jgi:PAS domain S-box-containing protein
MSVTPPSTFTDQDQVIKQLEELKYALDQSAIVVRTNAKGIIQYANDKFCEISGYSLGELIGKTHRVVNSGVHDSNFFSEMWQTISAGKVWRGEICNRNKAGKLYWVATTIVPFLDEQKKPIQYLAIRQDITALKEAQNQLVMQSRMSAIGEMASAITHEINNPLGVILGRCEMLKLMIANNKNDPATFSRMLETIEITGKRIEKIVKSMRTLSHQGEDDPFIRTPVKDIVQEALDIGTERFRSHGIRVSVSEFDRDLEIDCRSHEVLQVLVNLLNNSLDALESLPEKWIRVEVQSKGPLVEISVTDSGRGIPDEILNKIFEPFYSTKRVQFGTGLGLSISRSLIQKHGGQLLYDSQSQFTRFVIQIPKQHQ